MASTQPVTQKTNSDICASKSLKSSCKTFHRKIYATYFCKFVLKLLTFITLFITSQTSYFLLTLIQFPADLATFTEEILSGKRHFLYRRGNQSQ